MFSINNTMREIMETPLIRSRIGNLFPSCWILCVKKEHWDHTMEQIKKEDTMEWGQTFCSDEFVECANLVLETVDKKRFCFVPLWTEKESLDFTGNYLPKAATNCEEDVWLFTGNPWIDQQAFAHTSGSASIPPYKTTVAAEKSPRPAVILCPGGGYEMLSYYSEGIQLAQRMERDGGYKAFILNSRIAPNKYPQPQMDLAMAVMHVRSHAKEYGIDPDNIIVVGASAGGHLCASEAYLYEELKEQALERLLENNKETRKVLKQRYNKVSARPDALGLLYPVISFVEDYHEGSYLNLTGGDPKLKEKLSVERHIDKNYPPTYAFANEDDGCVPVSNTIRLEQRLQAAGIRHQCDIYPQGDHGIGLGYETSAKRWSEEMLKFLERK